jgi:iron complex transport system substrate-binding protein
VTILDRRHVLVALAAAACPIGVRAQDAPVSDAADRLVVIPEKVARVFPAGPPAAIWLYTLAPDLLLGWPRAIRPEEQVYLLPDIAKRPEVGRLTGRGNTANLEVVLASKPDLILDVGSTDATYVSLANRVQAQTGIAYALLDGRLEKTAESYRILGRLVRREADAAKLAAYAEAILETVRERVTTVPPERRPRTYYARGPRGLETGLAGSINVEALEFMGARNVAGGRRGSLATVSLEQVLAWDPEVIITIDQDFARNVRANPNWASVSAVRSGRVHLSPKLPFGWVDFPPAVNRLVGLWWLGKALYPELFPEDLKPIAREFYARFYHVSVTDEQLNHVLAGRG